VRPMDQVVFEKEVPRKLQSRSLGYTEAHMAVLEGIGDMVVPGHMEVPHHMVLLDMVKIEDTGPVPEVQRWAPEVPG